MFVLSVVQVPHGEFVNDNVNKQKHHQLRREDGGSVELRGGGRRGELEQGDRGRERRKGERQREKESEGGET